MSMRIITVEREYGSGGARIAEKLARRLGWRLWDTKLTQEIARRAHVNPEAAARHDERVDPLLYRLFKVFARGGHERALPIGEGQSFDTDSMVNLLGSVIEEVAESGNRSSSGAALRIFCGIVRTCFTFSFSPLDEKIRRCARSARAKRKPANWSRLSTKSALNSSSVISAPLALPPALRPDDQFRPRRRVRDRHNPERHRTGGKNRERSQRKPEPLAIFPNVTDPSGLVLPSKSRRLAGVEIASRKECSWRVHFVNCENRNAIVPLRRR